jgi:hypothetical protein
MKYLLVIALVLLTFTQVLGFNLEFFQTNGSNGTNGTTSKKSSAVAYQGSLLVGFVLSLLAYLFN